MKLLNFIGLLFSVARLLWRALCFSWNHGGQLRDLTDELRKVLTDGQLAVHGVTLGTATLKLVNANSVPVQALTDQARHLLETDLPGTALTAAGTALDATQAQRVELNKLVLALQRVLAKPALVEKSLAVANRALAVADTQDGKVTDLFRALEHVLAQQTLAASTLPVMTKALDVMTTSLTTPTLIAINSRLLALLSTPLPVISLGLSEKALKVAEDNQATLVQTIATLTDLLGRPTPAKSLELIMNALRVARQNETPLLDTIRELTTLLNTPLPGPALSLAAKSLQVAGAHEPRLQQTVGRLESLLNTPPVEETFRLAEQGAAIYWNNSAGLLNLLISSRGTLMAAGKAGVMTSYFLNGEAARSGMTPPPELQTPDALKSANVAQVVRASLAGLTEVWNMLRDVAAGLRGFSVEVPTGDLVGRGTGFTVSVLGNSATLYTEGWTVDTDPHTPFEALAKKFHDPNDPNNQDTATKKVNKAIGHLVGLQARTEAESNDLYVNGLTLFEIGRAL